MQIMDKNNNKIVKEEESEKSENIQSVLTTWHPVFEGECEWQLSSVPNFVCVYVWVVFSTYHLLSISPSQN